jgi:microcystin degradation protein MlrC
VLDTSVVEGYPYADVSHMGMAWVAVADADVEAAKSAAR